MQRLSIVIPVYYGEKTIEALVEKTCQVLHDQELEIILVNDGSKDKSALVCESIAQKNSIVTFVNLRRNYGEHNAVICGLRYVTGKAAVIIDDDFQNPPQEILKLVSKFNEGYDVVYSRYTEKKHPFWRNLGSKLNDIVTSFLLDKPRGLYLSSFKLISKEVVDEIVKYDGPYPYIDGLIFRVTDNVASCLVEHLPSAKDGSTYSFRKLVRLQLSVLVNFSVFPLRLCTVMGIVSFFMGLLMSIVFIVEKFIDPQLPLGWASLIVSFLLLSGVQLLSLGLLGEYMGKLYLYQSRTPQFTVKRAYLNRFH